jgi:hypothetical protein
MAVFAICITAPLGAIFINTLGPKWLEKSEHGAEYEGEVFDAALNKTLRKKEDVIAGLKNDEENTHKNIEMTQQKLEEKKARRERNEKRRAAKIVKAKTT